MFSAWLARSGAGAARPLPDRYRPLAAAIAGRHHSLRVVTGPESRNALRATGARAATIGRTVYLPRYPEPTPRALGILGHELAHAADHDRRRSPTTAGSGASRSAGPGPAGLPRFFGGVGSLADRGEALASRVGQETERAATAAGGDGLLDGLASAGARELAHGPRSAGGRLSAGARSGTGGLPVGGFGGGGLGAMLGTVLRAARDQGDHPTSTATAAANTLAAAGPAAGGGLATGAGLVPGTGSGLATGAGVVGDLVAAGPGHQDLGGGATGGGSPPAEVASLAAGIPDQGAGMAGPAARGVLGGSASAASDSYSQLSELLEQMEERLLVEIERRGGRYAGVF